MRNRLTAFCCALLLTLGLGAEAQRLIVTDSGGVERTVTRLIVTDSGSTEREIQRLFVIDSGGTARLVFSVGTVTVTGANLGIAGESVVRLTIETDGTLYSESSIGGANRTQLSPSTDWIIPNGAASASYEVRYVNYAGSAGNSSLTENVWAPINQQHVISLNRTPGEGNGQDSNGFDLEIRLGSSGAALDSGHFTMCAERGTFFC